MREEVKEAAIAENQVAQEESKSIAEVTTAEKPKKKKLNGGQIILIIIAIGLIVGFVYYWFCLKPTPENPYVGVWDLVYETGEDGSYESGEDIYGIDRPLGTRDLLYFYADGTTLQHGTSACATYDIWLETDDYILLVTGNNKYYKDGDMLYLEYEYDDILYRTYYVKTEVPLPEKE